MSQPTSLDPAFLRDSASTTIARQIFEPLLHADHESLLLTPGLAEAWEVSEGGAKFHIRLKRGIRFENGRNILAGDVVFSLNRLARKSTNSEAAFLVEAINGFREVGITGESNDLAGVRAIDERTVEITLATPWVDFLYVLTHPSTAPVPAEELQAHPDAFQSKPIGSGPYSLAGPVVSGTNISLVRSATFAGRKPPIGRVEFVVYGQPEAAWRDFEEGKLDIVDVPPGRVSFARRKYGGEGFSPVAAGVYLGFNLRNPKLQDLRLRQAISLAIDRQRIALFVYQNAMVPGRSLIPKGIQGRSELACGKLCTQDVERARALVKQAFPLEPPPEIAYDFPAGLPDDAVAAFLQSSLREIGVSLVLRPRERELHTFFEVLQSKEHEMYRLIWPAEYPHPDWFLNPLFRTGSADNHSAYSAIEVDELMAKGRTAPSQKDRLAFYRRAERRVLQDLPVIPVGFFQNRYVASSRLRDFYADQLGAFEISRFSFET